jgi:hypothetical protein
LFKPSAKPLQLLEWQVSDRFLDVFKRCHGRRSSRSYCGQNICRLPDWEQLVGLTSQFPERTIDCGA